MGDFQTAWAGKSYVKQLSYKIPGADITNEYVSFSREFDVDLSDFESNNPVYAFIGTDSKIYSGGGDYGTATNHIKMTSIQTSGTDDNGNSVSYDGTYIPAGTGVLLKVWNSDQTATPSDFYYRIGELDLNTAQDNLMKPVTVNAATLDGSKYDYWLMSKSKGVFQQIDPNNSAFNLAIHKAYLQFDKNSAAKLAFEFNEQPTDIKQIKTVREIKTPYYNLNGIVVPHPQHGIYIHNGDKIILK